MTFTRQLALHLGALCLALVLFGCGVAIHFGSAPSSEAPTLTCSERGHEGAEEMSSNRIMLPQEAFLCSDEVVVELSRFSTLDITSHRSSYYISENGLVEHCAYEYDRYGGTTRGCTIVAELTVSHFQQILELVRHPALGASVHVMDDVQMWPSGQLFLHVHLERAKDPIRIKIESLHSAPDEVVDAIMALEKALQAAVDPGA